MLDASMDSGDFIAILGSSSALTSAKELEKPSSMMGFEWRLAYSWLLATSSNLLPAVLWLPNRQRNNDIDLHSSVRFLLIVFRHGVNNTREEAHTNG